MTDIRWPYDILPPRRVTPEPVYATMGGGRSLTAVEQIIASDAGFWSISLEEIPIVTGLQKKVWRGTSVLLEGRLNPIIVPTYDTDTNPWPIVNGVEVRSGGPPIPHSDGSYFSDSSGYTQSVITATIVANVSLGAVQMSINLVYGSQLEPGQHFSVNHRLFRIKRVTSIVGSVHTVVVWPPTREAIAGGAEAEFDRPTCKCRLATDNEMMSGKDDYAGRTLASVNFVEFLP